MTTLPYKRLSLLAATALLSGAAYGAVDFKTCAKPVYPRESLRHEQTGTVTLGFEVSPDGKVLASRVDNSSGYPLLDIAAKEAIERCRFTPTGAEAPRWLKVQYVWTLKGSKSDGSAEIQAAITGAASGEPKAMSDLALAHMMGAGVKKDTNEAKRLLELAAAKDYVIAFERLGTGYETGLLGKPDPELAVFWMRKGALAGSALSQAFLGRMLVNLPAPLGAPAEGVEWLRKSADQQFAIGETFLGMALLGRAKSAADFSEAIAWLEKGAAQDNREAQFQLGMAYWKGIGVQRDTAKAAAFFAKPVAAGHQRARLALTEMGLPTPATPQ